MSKQTDIQVPDILPQPRGFMQRLGRRIMRRYLEAVELRQRAVAEAIRRKTYQEALGDSVSLDPDYGLRGNQNQALFRGIGELATGDKDFTPADRAAKLELSNNAYHQKGGPRNALEIAVDFIVGEGWELAPTDEKDEDLKSWLKEFWTGAPNLWDTWHHELITTHLVDGELLISVEQVQLDGKTGFGLVEARDIIDIQQDRMRRDVVAMVRNPNPSLDAPLRYAILNSIADDVEIAAEPDPAQPRGGKVTLTYPGGATGEFDGAGFLLACDRIAGARHGKPYLLHSLDTMDQHDEINWRMAERARVLAMMIFHLQGEGYATRAELNALTKDMGLDKAPTSLTTYSSNEKVTLNPIEPKLGSDELAILEQRLRLNWAGSFGYPEAWTGAGEDTNRATLAEQGSVPSRRLRRRQAYVMSVFSAMIRFAIRNAVRAGVLGANEEPPEEGQAAYDPIWKRFKILAPEIGSKDMAALASALSSLANALVAMASDSMVRREFANSIFTQAVREAGFEYDGDLEGVDLERLEEAAQRLQTLTDGSGAADEEDQKKAKDRFEEALAGR